MPRTRPGARDLRDMPLVTIDGAGRAGLRRCGICRTGQGRAGGWSLPSPTCRTTCGPATPLDQEAARRGTSAYFPDRVVPMLPEQLSNGLCSLNPDVDRLCMVCDMQVTRDGDVQACESSTAPSCARASV